MNEVTVKTINGTRYKVRSVYVGEKDFRRLFADLVVAKAARQSRRCNGDRNAV